MFVVMICDGLSMRLAFARAGFESKDVSAPAKLFNLPRIQERVNKVLEARRTTGVLSLAEVTDMLKRVYAGAQSAEEYSAAHNAAFSLARLYGHVTDRATVEIIRRPSRDPDAPSEQALSSWVESLPSLTIDADPLLRAGSSSADQGQISAPQRAPESRRPRSRMTGSRRPRGAIRASGVRARNATCGCCPAVYPERQSC